MQRHRHELLFWVFCRWACGWASQQNISQSKPYISWTCIVLLEPVSGHVSRTVCTVHTVPDPQSNRRGLFYLSSTAIADPPVHPPVFFSNVYNPKATTMSSININSSDSDSDSDDDAPVHPSFEDDFQLNVPDKKQLVKGPISETQNSKEPISKKPSSSGKTTGLEDVSAVPPTVRSSTNDDDEHHRSFAESFSQHVPDKHPLPMDKMPALEDVSQVHPPHGADNLARTRSLVLPPPPEETSVEFRSVPNLRADELFKEEETQSSPGMRKKRSSLKDATQPKSGYGKSRAFLSDASQPNPGSRKTRSMNIENTTSTDMLIDEAAIKDPSPDKLMRDAPGSANLKTTTGADMI
eukprot:scaffold1045_cov183-Cylindrotheca_fusiformis.AAC.1